MLLTKTVVKDIRTWNAATIDSILMTGESFYSRKYNSLLDYVRRATNILEASDKDTEVNRDDRIVKLILDIENV